MPLTGGDRGATDDACSVGRWRIPQVSQLVLRGVAIDGAGHLIWRGPLDEAFLPGSVFNARRCAACATAHDWADLLSPRCRWGSTACSGGTPVENVECGFHLIRSVPRPIGGRRTDAGVLTGRRRCGDSYCAGAGFAGRGPPRVAKDSDSAQC
jgi:hypothetical protein